MSLALAIAIILVPGWAYLIGSAIAALCFARRPLPMPSEHPPVSILKPLHGAEPGLYENLRSFVEQDYPTVQVVLGVGDRNDTALLVADALIRNLPAADIALVLDPPVRGSNLKVANLENMITVARHDTVVIADSDMRVDPHYLAAVTAPLHDPVVGLVTCLYEGVSTGGVWSELGALHINFGFLPGALVAAALGHRAWLLWRDDCVAAGDTRPHRRIREAARRACRRPPDRRSGARAGPRRRAVAIYR